MNLLEKAQNLAADITGKAGNLQNWYIIVEGVECVKDDESISKIDSYLRIDFGGQSERTRTSKNDNCPNWNETFNFKLHEGHVRDVHIKLLGANSTLNNTIGTSTISNAQLPSTIGEERRLKIPIIHNDEIKGMVNLRIKLMLENEPYVPTSYTFDKSSKVHTIDQTQQPYNQMQSTNVNQPLISDSSTAAQSDTNKTF